MRVNQQAKKWQNQEFKIYVPKEQIESKNDTGTRRSILDFS
jgi:hypothetical protein